MKSENLKEKESESRSSPRIIDIAKEKVEEEKKDIIAIRQNYRSIHEKMMGKRQNRK